MKHCAREGWVSPRRRGYGPEDAPDLTQEFFAELLSLAGISRTVTEAKASFALFSWRA